MLIRRPAWICLICLIFGGFSTVSSPAFASETLTDQDRKLDCPGVRAAISDVTVQIKRAEAVVRKENATPPTSLVQMLQASPPSATATQLKTLRLRASAWTSHASARACDRLDVMTKSRLGGAVVKPALPVAERCRVNGELSLQDCAEDVAKWRCRAAKGTGRAYLVCLDSVAERLITASGYDVTTLAHYDPGCGDVASPTTCSVFVVNRSGPDTRWCKRTSETTLDVCEPPKAGAPAIAVVAAAPTTTTSATPLADKPAVSLLPPGTTCRPVACQLGTSCNRLCAPPD